MMVPVFALLLPGVAVWLVLRAVGLRGRPGSAMLGAAVAVAGGVGLSAATTFWLAVLGLTRGPAFVTIDALTWITTGVVAWWWTHASDTRFAPSAPDLPARANAIVWLARGVFILTAAIAVATLVAHYRAAPHGEWDAWAIWNQKARFFFRGGERWTDVMEIAWSNPSHPVLVSASVARLWAYAGEESTFAPALLSATFGAVIVAGLVGALDARRPVAWLAGAVVMAPSTFTQLAAAQTADLPTGMFVLLSVALLGQALFASSRLATWLVAAGALGSLAAWTKNEGVVFLLVSGTIAAAVLLRRGEFGRMAWWTLGAAPVLLTVVWFKIAVATAAPLYMSEPLTREAIVSRALAVERHQLIDGLMVRMGLQWGGPYARGSLVLVSVAALLAASVSASRTARLVLGVAGPMLVSYYAVYLLSPLDTMWLVSTTFDRLTVQVWPALVLAACSVGAARGGGRENA